jgi:serine/threonine protein kinase
LQGLLQRHDTTCVPSGRQQPSPLHKQKPLALQIVCLPRALPRILGLSTCRPWVIPSGTVAQSSAEEGAHAHVFQVDTKAKIIIDRSTSSQSKIKFHEEQDQQFALKLIKAAKKHAYDKEIEIFKLMNHPNIVRLIEHGLIEDIPFLVMELARDGDLFKLIQDQAFDGPDGGAHAEIIGRGLLAAVAYIHRCGYIHRDLKTENILIAASGEAKICDFGLAVKKKGIKTVNMKLGGTPSYLAPEMVHAGLEERGIDYTLADEWALGLIFIFLADNSFYKLLDDPLLDVSQAGHVSGWSPQPLQRMITLMQNVCRR